MGWMVTLLRSSKRKRRFITGTPPFGLHPCLYSDVPLSNKLDILGGLDKVTLLRSSKRKRRFITGVETPACILTSRWDLCLSCFTRHFGRRLGITNKFVLLSACSKIGWTCGGLRVTLLRSSVWKIHFIQGLRPSGYIPACNLTSLRDLCLSCFTRHFGRRLGITNKFVLLSACSIVQLRRTFWAAPRDNK